MGFTPWLGVLCCAEREPLIQTTGDAIRHTAIPVNMFTGIGAPIGDGQSQPEFTGYSQWFNRLQSARLREWMGEHLLPGICGD
jgi:hypothetical protein